MQLYDDVVISGVSVIAFCLVITWIRIIGRKAAYEKFIYLISFHWVLKAIIKYRNGTTPTEILNREFINFIENDEEFVSKTMKQE